MEVWKNISEHYEISNFGRVRSIDHSIIRSNGRIQKINSKILTPITANTGYLKVRIRLYQGKSYNLIIHRQVALLFVDGYKNNLQVNHIDGNKNNNRADNLEWVTSKENINHAWKTGLSKPTNEKSIRVNNKEFISIKDASLYLGVNRNTITKAIDRGYYQAQKYEVIFNNIKYESLKEASKRTGLNPKTIEKYGNINYPEKIKVEFI